MRLPVILWPRKSRQLTILICLVHALAALAIAASGLASGLKLAVWVPIVASLWWQMRAPVPREIVLKADGRLVLIDSDGSRREMAVAPATTVHRRLIVLRARDQGRVRTLVFPVDALGAAGHRQLRVWLRWLAVSVPA
jgi:hypothetical protein